MKIILFASLIFAVFAANAQKNLLKNDIGSFEGKKSGWWRFQKDNVKFIKGKSSKGSYSLKFQRKPGDEKLGNLQASHFESLEKPLRSGKYKVELSFFLGRKAPLGFNVNFMEKKKFIPVSFKLKEVKKGRWVKLIQDVEFKRAFDGKIVLSLLNRERFGGLGTIYVDDLKLYKVQ